MMMMMMMLAAMLGSAAGQACNTKEIFRNFDFTSAVIPSDCTKMGIYGDEDIGDIGVAALAEALKGNTL